jgi:hypothetical protein
MGLVHAVCTPLTPEMTSAITRARSGLANGPRGMKQKEAKALITREWERWLQTQSIDVATVTGRETLKFYFELQDSKSTLLDFQSRGRDKWHIINSWLLREQHCFSD